MNTRIIFTMLLFFVASHANATCMVINRDACVFDSNPHGSHVTITLSSCSAPGGMPALSTEIHFGHYTGASVENVFFKSYQARLTDAGDFNLIKRDMYKGRENYGELAILLEKDPLDQQNNTRQAFISYEDNLNNKLVLLDKATCTRER